MSDNNGGFWGDLTTALLGSSAEDDDRLRQQYGLLGVEAPSVLARIGRGMVDVGEPIKQFYLNAYHPQKAAQYAKQRKADEAIYQRGLLAAHPTWATPDPMRGGGIGLPYTDPWRVAGRVAFGAPFMGAGPGIGASILPTLAEAQLWDQAQALRKLLPQYGVQLPSFLTEQ